MSGFEEIIFPTRIGFGSTVSPERRTRLVDLASGFEERNGVWANSRRKWDVSTGVKRIDDMAEVFEFWEAMNAKLIGFRFRDFLDHKSCRPTAKPQATDQAIGTGDGAEDAFQLVKAYTRGSRTWSRTINKPVAGSVLVAVAGTIKTEGTHFNVDATTGVVTFTGGNVPTSMQAITAGFEFDLPARFDTDELTFSADHFNAGQIPQIMLKEIRV